MTVIRPQGGDNITQHVLKNCSESLSCALEIIFGKSLIEGDVPNEWREANVTPLFKKGSKLMASNYRTVSLTSVCCKIMEGIIYGNYHKSSEFTQINIIKSTWVRLQKIMHH